MKCPLPNHPSLSGLICPLVALLKQEGVSISPRLNVSTTASSDGLLFWVALK
ncbi:MAG: hypothetical protein ACOC8S_05715 [Bacteroidota bacterium]